MLPVLLLSTLVLSDDPAPPEVQALPPVEAPPARPFDGLTTHRPPRALPADAPTEDWGSFLGPRRDGSSLERLTGWGAEGPPLLWEVEVGEGYSQPVVAEGRVVVHHRVRGQLHTDCLDAETGRRYWRHSLPCAYRGAYPIGDDGTRSTPTIDDGFVYVHGLEGGLVCLELATGRVRWQRNLRAEFGLEHMFFGVVSSPLLVGERLFINVGAPGPEVACFDKATGRMLWGASGPWGASCASPMLTRIGGREWLMVMTGGDSRPPTGGLVVLRPEDGGEVFRYPFRSRTYESVNAATPLALGDQVFLTAAYGVGAAGIAWSEGEGFSEAWRARRGLGLQFSNPVALGGEVFALDGKSDRIGELVRLDPRTGEERGRTPLAWEETFVYGGREVTVDDMSVGEGSLLVVEGRLLILGDRGHLLWVDVAGEEPRVLARSWLIRARTTWTPPALSRGLLYVRQSSRETLGERSAPRRVLCYDLRPR